MALAADTSSLISVARDFIEAGISVVPLRLDGSKAPDSNLLPQVCDIRTQKQFGTWQQYQTRLAIHEELERWYRYPAGIGLVAGVVSGGLEILDFDDGSLFEPWRKSVESIACWLPIVETPSGGYHVFYRCEIISGSQKIAVDSSRQKPTLVESRGDRGYVAGVGSPTGIHRNGIYVQTMGPVLPEVPTISTDDRKALWRAARVFDKSETLKSFLPKPKTTLRKNDGDTPWDDFNRRASWSEVLKGWTESAENRWTRPGKSHGVSAMVRKARNDDAEVLVVFSSNAGEIAPISENHRTLSKFEAFKKLQHNGDGKAATKAVVALGYGGAR
ncbi:MAG: bifunctional DNA primase/polymerase [Pirellula sp.]